MNLERTHIFWKSLASDGGVHRWSRLGLETSAVTVPAEIIVEAIGTRGEPDLRVVIEILNGVPEPTSLHLDRSPKGRGLRRNDLRELPGLEKLSEMALVLFARKFDPDRFDPAQSGEWNLYQAGTRVLSQQAMRDAGVGIHVNFGGEDTYETVGVPDISNPTFNHAFDQVIGRKRGASTAEIEQVAEIYRRNLSTDPTGSVQRFFGYSARTAARRVQQARDAELLPKTTQGRKKA